MDENKGLNELFRATAKIFLDTLRESHRGQPVFAVCDTVAFWLAQFCVATMRATLQEFSDVSDNDRLGIAKYLLAAWNTMFWKGVAEFKLLSDKEIQALKEMSFRFPNITH